MYGFYATNNDNEIEFINYGSAQEASVVADGMLDCDEIENYSFFSAGRELSEEAFDVLKELTLSTYIFIQDFPNDSNIHYNDMMLFHKLNRLVITEMESAIRYYRYGIK